MSISTEKKIDRFLRILKNSKNLNLDSYRKDKDFYNFILDLDDIVIDRKFLLDLFRKVRFRIKIRKYNYQEVKFLNNLYFILFQNFKKRAEDDMPIEEIKEILDLFCLIADKYSIYIDIYTKKDMIDIAYRCRNIELIFHFLEKGLIPHDRIDYKLFLPCLENYDDASKARDILIKLRDKEADMKDIYKLFDKETPSHHIIFNLWYLNSHDNILDINQNINHLYIPDATEMSNKMTHRCYICLSRVKKHSPHFRNMASCNCIYHIDCIFDYIRMLINSSRAYKNSRFVLDFQIPQCPGCQKEMLPSFLFQVLGLISSIKVGDRVVNINSNYLVDYFLMIQDCINFKIYGRKLFFCINDCGMRLVIVQNKYPYKDTVFFHCPACQRKKQIFVNVDALRKMDNNKEDQSIIEKLLRNTKRIRPCPKCGKLIEKNGGCSHMTCKFCSYNYDWHRDHVRDSRFAHF